MCLIQVRGFILIVIRALLSTRLTNGLAEPAAQGFSEARPEIGLERCAICSSLVMVSIKQHNMHRFTLSKFPPIASYLHPEASRSGRIAQLSRSLLQAGISISPEFLELPL